MKSNLCERPLKFLIDTGASITLLAEDVISEKPYISNYVINLYGVTGKDVSIKTKGMVFGVFSTGSRCIETALHIIDRKYAGPGDGYIGYDLLSAYGAVINITTVPHQAGQFSHLISPISLKLGIKTSYDQKMAKPKY